MYGCTTFAASCDFNAQNDEWSAAGETFIELQLILKAGTKKFRKRSFCFMPLAMILEKIDHRSVFILLNKNLQTASNCQKSAIKGSKVRMRTLSPHLRTPAINTTYHSKYC